MDKKEIMHVLVSKVDGAVFDGEAVSVIAPGSEGVLTILPEHEALITPLADGDIHIQTETDTQTISVEKGMLEVSDNQVSILM